MMNKRSRRDKVSGLIHGIAVLLSIVGLIVLLVQSISPIVRVLHIVTFSVFGAGLILLYTASTLYHVLPVSDSCITRLRKFDHLMIFLLIAGTYTPVCLIPLRGPWGWSIFAGIWILAITGVVIETLYPKAPRRYRAGLYVAMGWFVIIAVYPVLTILKLQGFLWLLAGGLSYTIGALIYAKKKPDPWPETFGFHEIFHVFVVFGSLFHYGLMYYSVLPVD